MIEDKATAEAALEAAKAAVAADERNASSPELAQKSCMDLVCKWQRELLEQEGLQHDRGMRLVWSIPEAYKPIDAEAKELLQAFGKLRMAVQATVSNACLEATKPPEVAESERRFKPADGPLQTDGELSRSTILKFTRDVAAQLSSEETIELLSKSGGQQQACALSVQWQRQLLEANGVQMDFGCRALGEVPNKHGQDKEVMTAFADFQKACQQSLQKAMHAEQIERTKPPEVAASERRFVPAAELQKDGELSRSKILKFTREAAAVLVDEESIALLVAAAKAAPGGPMSQAGQSLMGQVSVQWQRQLLEKNAVQDDFGCRALGEVPQRFGKDAEVMTAFQGFTNACMQSMKMAMEQAAK